MKNLNENEKWIDMNENVFNIIKKLSDSINNPTHFDLQTD